MNTLLSEKRIKIISILFAIFVANLTFSNTKIVSAIDEVIPTPSPTEFATPTIEPTPSSTIKPTATPTIRPTATPTTKPTIKPTPKPTAKPFNKNAWNLKLVNPTHKMKYGYVPNLQYVESGFYFDKRAAPYLKKMLRVMRSKGLSPVLSSTYRSVQTQRYIFNNQVSRWQSYGYSYSAAFNKAKTIVAYPRTSEHALGLAADIVCSSYTRLYSDIQYTKEIKWLKKYSYKYGFILRYPANKTKITKIMYEPWHYRYVGVRAATKIKNSGKCFEEFIKSIS